MYGLSLRVVATADPAPRASPGVTSVYTMAFSMLHTEMSPEMAASLHRASHVYLPIAAFVALMAVIFYPIIYTVDIPGVEWIVGVVRDRYSFLCTSKKDSGDQMTPLEPQAFIYDRARTR